MAARLESPTAAVSAAATDADAAPHPAVAEFALGLAGLQPSPGVIAVAARIAQAALARTVDPELSIDVDGALSLDLRLDNGLLILAELAIDGTLDATLFDDSAKPNARIVRHLPQASPEEMLNWLRLD